MDNFKIYNGFGITPTTTYTAAGYDFYIPNIKDSEHAGILLKAFEKSYNKNEETVNADWASFVDVLSKDGFDASDIDIVNILHLYYAYDSDYMRIPGLYPLAKVDYFVHNVLVYSNERKDGPAWGLSMNVNDSICINSGIKVALNPGYAGIFFNKSGRGNEGWDVRAQVVDEDYAGYVHLSLAYTKETDTKPRVVFCGEKITQMVILPVSHLTPTEVSEDEYNELMKNSNRGSNWNGSSNDTMKTI